MQQKIQIDIANIEKNIDELRKQATEAKEALGLGSGQEGSKPLKSVGEVEASHKYDIGVIQSSKEDWNG